MGAAIALASENFSNNEKIGKAIVLITDAEDHEANAVSMASEVAKKGIKLYVVGVGTSKGGMIPLGGKNNYLHDKKNAIVITKLNHDAGREIATAGNGVYVNADSTNVAQDFIEKEFSKLAKDEVKSEVITKFNEQYVYIILLAFILLMIDSVSNAVIDFLTGSRKDRKYKK